MIILLVGPQGCGKGTQAKFISEKLSIPHISTGDLFRSLVGEKSEQVKKITTRGELVPDSLTLEILKERIEKKDCEGGFILDGFPRNLNQAKELNKIVNINLVLEISISDEESIRRLSGRMVCPDCKKSYNILSSPKPQVQNKCDDCKINLITREDDTEESIKKRLDTYHKETELIIEFYRDKLKTVSGENTIENIKENIFLIIDSLLD